MKNIGKIIGASIVGILFLSGMGGVSACQLDTELIAGQNWDEPVGNVNVNHPGSTSRYMYITYTTTGGWELTETHLAVAESFDDIPQNKKGNPKIGHFPYSDPHGPVSTYTYTIDLDDFPSLFDPDTGKYLGTLFVAAHAVVEHPDYGEETAWADTYGQPFNEGNGWALWFSIELD